MKNYHLDGWGRGYIEQWRKKKKKLHRSFRARVKILHDGNICRFCSYNKDLDLLLLTISEHSFCFLLIDRSPISVYFAH